MFSPHQTTLEQEVRFRGVGLHTGRHATLTLYPAPENTGIVFVDSDLKSLFPATLESVLGTEYCVTLGSGGVSVATVEHLLSAIMALGLSNVLIHCDGPEIPLMDGSSWPFFFHLRAAGIMAQKSPRLYALVTQEVFVDIGRAKAVISPAPRYDISVTLEYDHPFIASEGLSYELDIHTASYERHIARARTYGFAEHQDFYRQHGLALGANTDNVLIFDAKGPVSNEPPRFSQEIVRHKILDVIGDLSLIGAPLIGRYEATCPGHTLNAAAGRTLLANDAIEWVSGQELAASLSQEASK